MKKRVFITISFVLVVSILTGIIVFADDYKSNSISVRDINQSKSIKAYQNLLVNMYNKENIDDIEFYDFEDDKMYYSDNIKKTGGLAQVYSGAYINDEGYLIVNVTDDSEEIKKQVTECAKDDTVTCKKVKYSYNELQTVYTELSSKLSEAPYYSVALMDRENRVNISTENLTECSEYIKSFSIDLNIINIIEKENTITDCALIRGGYGCTCPVADSVGTIGFSAKRTSSNGTTIKGIVTAAHVVRKSDGTTLGNEVKRSGNKLGTVISSSYGNRVDAAFVEVKNGILPPWWTLQPKLSDGNNINGWGNVSYTPVGTTITKYGGTSNITSGQVLSISLSILDSNGYSFYNLTQTSAYAIFGDSGGPCIVNNNGDKILVGIAKGVVSTNNAYEMYYCKINYVLSDILVTPIVS